MEPSTSGQGGQSASGNLLPNIKRKKVEQPDELAVFREFILGLHQFEVYLWDANVLPEWPTGAQISRLNLLRDAVQRCRRQIGHFVAELVLGNVLELEARLANREKKFPELGNAAKLAAEALSKGKQSPAR